MRSDVDSKLTAYVERTPGATLSSTVNEAVLDYLERQAIEAYREWDRDAPPEERAFLDALDASGIDDFFANGLSDDEQDDT